MSELATKQKFSFFNQKISREQSKDSGLALLLIFMIAGIFSGNVLFYETGIAILLVVMIVPGWFYPFALVWYGLSHMLGTVMSKVILALVFFIIVVPVAALRRLFGIDSLRLRAFKKGSETAMHIRNHTYVAADIEKPY